MAITREQVLEAVEKYLPRTVNFAQSADLGNRDQDAIFARIQQILLTSLLVDKEAVYYIIYLSAQRLIRDINATIALIDALQSTDQLKGITGEDPYRIADYTQLEDASTSLVRLSNDVVTLGVFSGSALNEFSTDISGFLSDEIRPNVLGGNRAQTSRDIRATMQLLQTSWASVVTRRDLLFTLLDKYVDEDLRTRVSSIIISAIQVTIQELLNDLPTLETSQQAEVAEQVMIDLAAAEASIRIVGAAASPVGTVVDLDNEGFTEANYLEVEGKGRLEPIEALRSGTDGKNKFTGPAAGGSSFTSVTGQTVAGTGTFTDTFEDPGVADFVADGIEADMYLTLVDVGTTHTITAVTPSQLTLSPTTKHLPATPQRYAITDRAPGELFESPTGSFWTEPGLGTTASTELASGTAGSFPRVVKATGSDGTNIVSSGTEANFRPRKAEGSTADQGAFGFPPNPPQFFQDLNATLLSDQVAPGDTLEILDEANAGTHGIVSVDTETTLTSTTVFVTETGGNTSWYVEDPDAEDWVDDAAATFLSNGVDSSYTIRFTSAPINGTGDYTILSALSQTRLELGGGPFLYETGADWEIRLTANNQIRSGTDFFVAGVVAGDRIDITGEGTFVITAVDQFKLTLDASLSSISLSSVSFTIYSEFSEQLTDRFTQTDGANFETLGIGALVEVDEYRSGEPTGTRYPATLTVDGIEYRVKSRDADSPTDTLVLFPLAQGVGEFTSPVLLEDPTQDFVALGVTPSTHSVYVLAGPNAGSIFSISVAPGSVTETTITISAPPAVTSEDNTYQIWPRVAAGPSSWDIRYGDETRHFFDASGANPFTADSVGWQIVWKPGAADEARAKVDTYIGPGEVWLSDTLPEGGTENYAYVDEIAQGQELVAAGRTYNVVEVVDETTLQIDPKLSNSVGKNVEYQILRSPAQTKFVSRVFDEAGAAAYNPVSGFTSDLNGLRVDLNIDRPVATTFSRPFDPSNDGFAEAFQVETEFAIGRRLVAYRITGQPENTTDEFLLQNPASAVTGDVLTVWENPNIFDITPLSATNLQVSPSIPARLTSQYYSITRDGGRNYGRYVLLSDLNDDLVVDNDTDLLRLTVAEVLLDFGEELINRATGVNGSVGDDGDADGESYIFSDAAATFLSVAKVGDRLEMDYGGSTGIRVSYVTRVVSDTALWVSPEVPEQASGITWSLDKNSVSAALVESERLRQQLVSLLDILENYTVNTNATVAGVIDLLEAQRLDRAVDLLYDGKMDEFINLQRLSSSYSTLARSSIQAVGMSTQPTAATEANLPGSNPALTAAGTSSTGFTTAGAAAAAGTSDELTEAQLAAGLSTPPAASPISSTGAVVGYGTGALPEDVEIRVALARAANDIADDELLRSLSFTTFEETRNRAIFELSGEIESGVITDTDPTLPWLAKTGSIRDRVDARYQAVRDAVQYMIDNPEKFDDAPEGTET
jgi:hypothetical protein